MYIYANFLEDGILYRSFSLVMYFGRLFSPRYIFLKKSFLIHYMVIKMCYWNTIKEGVGLQDFIGCSLKMLAVISCIILH